MLSIAMLVNRTELYQKRKSEWEKKEAAEEKREGESGSNNRVYFSKGREFTIMHSHYKVESLFLCSSQLQYMCSTIFLFFNFIKLLSWCVRLYIEFYGIHSPLFICVGSHVN